MHCLVSALKAPTEETDQGHKSIFGLEGGAGTGSMSGNEKTSSDPTRAVASGSNSERRHGVPSSMGRQVEWLKDRLRALEEEDDVAKQDFYKSLHEINKLMTEIRHHFRFHFLHQSRVGVVHHLHEHGIGRGRAAGSKRVQQS